MRSQISKFFHDERGMETVEWTVLTALLISGACLTLGTLGAHMCVTFSQISEAKQ